MNLKYLTCLLLFCQLLQAQTFDFSASSLDDLMTRNANAVVLLDATDIEILSRDNMRLEYQQVVRVLNEEGNRVVTNYAYYDKVSKLKDLHAEIYDRNGKLIKRIKHKDFKDITAIDGFTIYTDSRLKYFRFTPVDYPYTISFSYTYETSNTAFVPAWIPLNQYEVSLAKSTYKISYPEDIQVRKKEKNFKNYPIESSDRGQTLQYQLENIPAIQREMLSPGFSRIAPRLLFAVDNFHLEGIDGFAQDWESLGKWKYENLLQSQDHLPPETIKKMGSELASISDPVEKIRKVYEYVQENTRYVSVQLGIGGWKPISAQEVDQVKYGDCKGLTNYTKALLKSQGIDSYYSVVWAGNNKRDMEHDFASIQGNHVILNVPVEGRDIWLECTSQDIPFGFLGDFTDDRDVLVVTPAGGMIKHTVAYVDETNRKFTKANYSLSEIGKLRANVELESTGITYDKRSSITGLSKDKMDEYYKEYWDNINGLQINSMELQNVKNEVVLRESLEVEANAYGSQLGKDLMFKINPFDMEDEIPTRYRSRKQPFEIQRGYLHQAEYNVSIPKSYMISEIPTPVNLSTKFGTYQMKVTRKENGSLVYQRSLLVKRGIYSKDEYNDYRNFCKEVSKYDNIKLLLNPKT